jgi:hypothetical protein
VSKRILRSLLERYDAGLVRLGSDVVLDIKDELELLSGDELVEYNFQRLKARVEAANHFYALDNVWDVSDIIGDDAKKTELLRLITEKVAVLENRNER